MGANQLIYEYMTVYLVDHPRLIPPTTIAGTLNEHAREGWRYVGAVHDGPGAPLAILERKMLRPYVEPR